MVKSLMKSFFVGVFVTAVAAPLTASAQGMPPQHSPVVIDLSGPRFGATVLDDRVRAHMADRGVQLGSMISQFGWQKEKRFLSSPTGFTGVTEWVVLLGGVDQGVVIPSLNWMVGARTAEGIEFAAGPNLTPNGLALAIAAGVTMKTGNLNIPLNFAVVPSKHGLRTSILAGFNMRRR